MPFATPMVPMPSWSTPIAIMKLCYAIAILAFVAACIAIWGPSGAFVVSLVTASISTLSFAYYVAAIGFKPSLYNKRLVLTLEAFLMHGWLISMLTLAVWIEQSFGYPQIYENIGARPIPTLIDLSARDMYRKDLMVPTSDSSGSTICKRRSDFAAPRTIVRVHGANARYAAQIMAGISAVLCGINLIMYAVTTITFFLNYSCPSHSSEDYAINMGSTPLPPNRPRPRRHPDEERALATMPTEHTGFLQPANSPGPSSSTPSSPTTPPGFFNTIEEATAAGVRPPTPIARMLAAERRAARDRRWRENAGRVGDIAGAQGRGSSTVVKEDGTREREV